MPCNSTVGIGSTDIRCSTRVDTFSWLACSVVRTIIVRQTTTHNRRQCHRFYKFRIYRKMYIKQNFTLEIQTYPCYMQLKDSQSSQRYIHRFLCDFWIDRWHLLHSWPGSMQEHSYPVNTSGQRSNHSQIHIVVWHSLKEGRKYRACIMGGNVKSFYPVHKCHHSQLMYPQDKYMPHSWWKCQWPHTAEKVNRDC